MFIVDHFHASNGGKTPPREDVLIFMFPSQTKSFHWNQKAEMKSDSCGQCSMPSMCPEKLCIFSIKRSWAHPFSQQTGHKKNGNKVFHRNHNYCPTNIHEDVTKEEMRHVGFVASRNNLLHRAVDTVFTKGWVNHAGEVLMSHCGEQGDSV